MTDFSWTSWTPEEVMRRLRDVDVPWAFVGGWALNLFRGSVSREHEDVEIGVPKASFWDIRNALPDLDFAIVAAARTWLLSDDVAFAMTHQTWGREPTSGACIQDIPGSRASDESL